jgi:hypothetical protein
MVGWMAALLPLQCTPPTQPRHHFRHVTVAGDRSANHSNISDQLHLVVARPAARPPRARLMIVRPGLETARGRPGRPHDDVDRGGGPGCWWRTRLVAMGQDPVGLRVAVGCLYNSGDRSSSE